jgi:general stress protein CsbA
VEFHCRINPATITRRMKRLILFARNLFINYLAISLMCVLLAPIKNRTYDASGLWCDRLYLIRIKRVMTLVRGTLTNWKQFACRMRPIERTEKISSIQESKFPFSLLLQTHWLNRVFAFDSVYTIKSNCKIIRRWLTYW